jgi:signal transduction histidine kinase
MLSAGMGEAQVGQWRGYIWGLMRGWFGAGYGARMGGGWGRRVLGLVPRLVDVLLPALMGLFLLGLVADSPDRVPEWVRTAGMVAGAAQGIALYWRRSYPRTVMAVAIVGGLAVQVIAPYGLLPYAGMVALWTLAAAQPPRVSVPALLALVGVTAASWRAAKPGDVPFAVVMVLVVWALGEATRNRLAAGEQAARRAAAQEQARLARELHDVIAHSVSVMVVQAAAADDVFETRPERARSALRAIEATGRDALGELRWLLAAMGPAGAERRPAPDLGRLDELVESVRAAGLRVDIERDGDADIPAGVGLSAYRIVQEALTNAVRHAAASSVRVRVATTPAAVEVAVLDDGRGGQPNGTGRGLAGMRERATLLGGTFDAGPRPGGGFGVRARIPLNGGGA